MGKSKSAKKLDLIDTHCGRIYEGYIRSQFTSAKRYWEKSIEIDFMTEFTKSSKSKLLVAEVKWSSLKENKKEYVLEALQKKFYRSKISKRFEEVDFKVFDRSFLAE